MVLYRASSPRSLRRDGILPKTGLAVCVGLSTGLLLSPPIFRAAAVVGVADAGGKLPSDALRTASELALSRSVLLSAAIHLVESKALQPQPTFVERWGVLASADNASGRAARLADQIHADLRIAPGNDGAISLSADAAEPAQAARIATAVAEALVSQRNTMIADPRSTDSASALQLAALRSAAALAHRRLASLAGANLGSTQVRAAATDQVAAAEAKVATLRATMASGSPPLAESKDVPQSVETLQADYLDLTRKLAIASETLGDRHTTIIALREGVRHASAALTTEWQRLLRIAESDLASARQREAAIGKGDASGVAHQAALDEARRAARTADAAVARAESQGVSAAEEQPFHLIAPAGVPAMPVAGWSLPARIIASLLAALSAFGLAGLAFRRRGPMAAKTAEVANRNEEPSFEASLPSASIEPSPELATTALHVEAPVQFVDFTAADLRMDSSPFFDLEPEPLLAKDEPLPSVAPQSHGLDLTPELEAALGDIVDDLVAISPAAGAVPTIMVASNEISIVTMATALSVAGAAVERGMRVLLVEGPRQQPELAGMAEADCEPMLADLFGNLRVVLQAEKSDALFLAPHLRNGAKIAAALVRNTQAPFLADLASEYDIIVVDGCRAADSAAAGLTADRYLRAGRFASQRDTERFLKTLDVVPETFLGTLAGSGFVPHLSEQDKSEDQDASLHQDTSSDQDASQDRDAFQHREVLLHQKVLQHQDAPQPAAVPSVARPQTMAVLTGIRARPSHVPVALRPAYPRRVASR